MAYFQDLCYLASACLFIVGLKDMSHPRTAVRGNLLGAVGMGLAVGAALLGLYGYVFIVIGMLIGSAVGAVLAYRVPMTAMPQFVALFNGFGGAASVFVAGGYLLFLFNEPAEAWTWDVMLATALSGLVGAITFWGSMVAYGKLEELQMFKKPLSLPQQLAINAVLAGVSVLLCILMSLTGPNWAGLLLFLCVVVLSSVLGVFLVNPIGGADMPVVIALLNSYSGIAAAMTGFVITNNALIISGSLVGASGIILTQLMCKAMNRSLTNVLFGSMAAGSDFKAGDEIYATVRSGSAEDAAIELRDAQRVVIVPGYGLAVAQAQHAVRDLANMLEAQGATVEYAIHPVAGRMPGHMNVLLAEADVPYDQLKEMDAINPSMETVDVAIVIGANDVVNPLARTDPTSPIAGMPIIDVDKARRVFVIKRSLSPGFAQIPNPLFAAENTLMIFGDAEDAVRSIITALKEL